MYLHDLAPAMGRLGFKGEFCKKGGQVGWLVYNDNVNYVQNVLNFYAVNNVNNVFNVYNVNNVNNVNVNVNNVYNVNVTKQLFRQMKDSPCSTENPDFICWRQNEPSSAKNCRIQG